MYTNYKDTPIHYDSRGKGTPLVLLHGFLETREIWEEFSQKLSEKRQIISIDLPGHGESGNFDKIHSMAEMAEAVHAVLQELNIEKASLAGHSMGGYVSLEFYKKFPTMTAALILVNSTPEADSEERKANRDRAVELVKKNKEAFVSMAISNLLTPENNKRLSLEVNKLKEKAYKISKEGITAAILGMRNRPDNTRLLSAYPGSKFIVAGKQDPVLEFNAVKKIAERCKCDFKVFPDGHLSLIENKEALLDFMHHVD